MAGDIPTEPRVCFSILILGNYSAKYLSSPIISRFTIHWSTIVVGCIPIGKICATPLSLIKYPIDTIVSH